MDISDLGTVLSKEDGSLLFEARKQTVLINMKKIILLFFLICPLLLVAQQYRGPVYIEYAITSDGGYRFNCMVTENRPYYVIVYFNEIQGLTSSRLFPYIELVHSGLNQLFTLKKTSENCSSYFKYRYRYLDGDPKAKHNDEFPYLFPVKHGNSCKVSSLTYVGKFINKEAPGTWAAYGFKVNPEDTIFASRGGVVIEVEEDFITPKDVPFFSSNRNAIRILHADGTIARYKNFKKDGIFPEVGDRIYAGTPIGISEPENSKRNQYISLMVYYPNGELLNLDKRQITKTDFVNFYKTIPKNDKSYWKYVKPKFITSTGLISPELNKAYVSEHSNEVIMFEMSKKDKKRWLRK